MVKNILLALIFFGVLAPSTSSAQTYTPSTQSEYIAYLQGIVTALQAQLGATGGSSDSRVTTLTPASAVTLRARFDIDKDRYAYAWFEYGEGSALNKKTARTKVSRSGNSDTIEHTAHLSNLTRGQSYSYRPVFETTGGRKYYGARQTIAAGNGNTTNNNNDYTNNDSRTLSVDKTRYEMGDSIIVQYNIPSSRVEDNNWIGIFKTSADDNEYSYWKYVDDSSGTLTVSVPYEKGNYEMRLFLDDSDRKYATSQRFSVTR